MRRITHDVVGSTNAEALTLARVGECAPFWVMAKRQTAGRGRRGSAWVSEEGNLYATLLLRDPAPRETISQLSFVAALGVADAIAGAAPHAAIALKWPNDVLLGGKKVAGILLETAASDVAVGIGINCATHPADTPFPATSLRAEGAAATADDIFASLDSAMTARLAQWPRGDDFASIRRDWLALAAGLGSEIGVRLPDRELRGTFHGLSDEGHLLLGRGDSVERISAGEVFGLPARVPA